MDLDEVDPHLLAASIVATIALEILTCLPQCDLVEEIGSILVVQHDILTDLKNRRHFGSERLDRFMCILSELQFETRKLKNANSQEN